MVGTRNNKGEKLFNRATNPRQPGSSIKPLSVYSPALQKSYEYQKKGKKFPFKDTGYDSQGKRGWGDYITAISSVRDEKMVVNGKVWPQNFSRTYTGNKTFRTAIQQSINTCAVKILAQIGVEYSMDMVKKFGITTMVDDTSEPYNDVNLAALGLGAMTEGVTPLEMALAYATFPNGGVRNSGICYTKVTDGDGKVLLKGESKETKVMDKGVAFIMTDVLQTVVSDGIAFNAAISGERVGGKTGTTDQTWDIWFDGFTPKYAAALWIGTDDNTELNTTSSTAAALWGKIMGQVKRAKGGTYKSKPDNVILKNGEYFTKGTQPPDPPPKKEDKKDKDKGKTDAKTDAKTDGKKDKKN
jgi:penicillin-binding protein 1A